VGSRTRPVQNTIIFIFFKFLPFVVIRIMSIQSEMSERALELLALPEDQPSFILDLGCGSGDSIDITYT
jgi:hypothetical protein